MKKLILAAAITSLTTLGFADTNLRLEPHFIIAGSVAGGADFYLNERTAIGINLFSTSSRGKIGLRYTQHWDLEASDRWLMVLDANAIFYEGTWDNDKNEAPVQIAGELRAMQQYRWQWQSGFNTGLGLGVFAVIDPANEYNAWFTSYDNPLPIFGIGEWTVGWRF